jgi:hypothetical protein
MNNIQQNTTKTDPDLYAGRLSLREQKVNTKALELLKGINLFKTCSLPVECLLYEYVGFVKCNFWAIYA